MSSSDYTPLNMPGQEAADDAQMSDRCPSPSRCVHADAADSSDASLKVAGAPIDPASAAASPKLDSSCIPPPAPASSPSSAASSSPSPRIPLALRVLLASAFIHSVGVGMSSVATPQMELYLFDQNAAAAATLNSVLSPITGIIGFQATLTLSALSDVYGRKFVLLLSLLASAASLMLTGVWFSIGGLIVGRVISSLFDPSEFVHTYTAFGAAFGGGLLSGPVLVIGLMALDPHRLPFICCAILTIINLFWLAKQLPETLQWRPRLAQARQELAAEEAADAARPPQDVNIAVRSEEAAATAVDDDRNPFEQPMLAPSPPSLSASPSPSPSSPLSAASPLEHHDRLLQPVPFVRLRPLTVREVLRTSAVNPFRSLVIMWTSPRLLRLSAALFIHSLGDGFLASVIFLFTSVRWGWGASENSIMLVGGGVLSILVMAVLAPRMQKRFGERRVLLLAQIGGIAMQLTLALSPWGWLVFLIGSIGSFNLLWTPILRAQIARQLLPEAQAELQGAIACLTNIATIIASALSSALFAQVSSKDAALYWPGLTFIVAAAINMLSIMISYGVDTSVPEHVRVAVERADMEGRGEREPVPVEAEEQQSAQQPQQQADAPAAGTPRSHLSVNDASVEVELSPRRMRSVSFADDLPSIVAEGWKD